MSTSSSPSDPTTLNIPSLLVFAVISVFAIRYFFFTSPSSSPAASSSSSNGRRVPADRIEQVASMFPQVNRREIEYDLSRNGANVAATTERVLREGRLPMVRRVSTDRSVKQTQANTLYHQAPPTFQAQVSPPSTQPSTASSSSASRPGAAQAPAYADLITRYGLKGRTEDTSTASTSTEAHKEKGGWSQNKEQRQALLRKRREDMVLEARRKMEERDRKVRSGA